MIIKNCPLESTKKGNLTSTNYLIDNQWKVKNDSQSYIHNLKINIYDNIPTGRNSNKIARYSLIILDKNVAICNKA